MMNLLLRVGCNRIAVLGALVAVTMSASGAPAGERARAREAGIVVGDLPVGRHNAITDVPGVAVGHQTLIRGENIRTGVTAILPHEGNIFQEKVPAAVYVGNGFGKLAGSTQISELGNIETPIILTSTLSVGTAINALVSYTLEQKGNESVRSVNAVVGETNDGYLNDIRGRHITEVDVRSAIENAQGGPVAEGTVGAGTGTRAFGFKGGIGTSSRIVQAARSRTYTVGVLVQSNFGGKLTINGAPFWKMQPASRAERSPGRSGSCMIIVATDAPLSERNLLRVAKRALHGMARTGASMSNGSGDYVIAFSTAYRISYAARAPIAIPPLVHNDDMDPLFVAAMDATEEAIYNSLLRATSVTGYRGKAEAIPMEAVARALEEMPANLGKE